MIVYLPSKRKKKKESTYEKIVLKEEIITTVTNCKREAIIEVPIDFKQIYKNAMLPLMASGLNVETALLIYLITTLDSTEDILNNKEFRIEFNIFCKENKNKGFSEPSVKRAFCFLEENKRLMRINKGVYQLNPIYFWDSTQENRRDAIKNIEHLLKEESEHTTEEQTRSILYIN